MNVSLRDELLAMKERDLRTRARLAEDGSLYDGYHPEMEAVHRENAARLSQIIDEHGWPGPGLVGEDGAEAAWLIVQHAIGEPPLQRRCLTLLQSAVERGDAPAWQAAYLEDRIRVYEGRGQRYGTQLDIGPDGKLIPFPIEDPERVDERRKAIGLPSLATHLAKAEPVPPLSKEVLARREREYHARLKRVGWRS